MVCAETNGKMGKWEKRLGCRGSHGFAALGRWRLFALTVEKGDQGSGEKRRRRDQKGGGDGRLRLALSCSVRIARGDDVSSVHVNALENTVTRELTAVTCHGYISPSVLCSNFVASNHKSSASIPTHLAGTPPSISASAFPLVFLGGSQTLALPNAFASSLPSRRMFISNTMTRRKSLFSRGSRCRTAGVGDITRPASERGDGFARLLRLAERSRRSYVCI